MALTEPQKKWVAALRSGRFPQTTNVLKDNEGFCCLGVACEIAIEEGVDVKVDEDNDYSYDGECSFLPISVKKWLGLNRDDGSFYQDGEITSLANMNDDSATFDEIANVIESEPGGLFV